jgi:hypothetical protein
MSVRIHVLGAYGAGEPELRAALDAIGDDGNGSAKFRIGRSGKWVWANASVWHVGGSQIDVALASLTVPALRVTSADAILWMLTLAAPGKELFRGVHHFTRVGAEPEQSVQPEVEHDDDFPDGDVAVVAGVNKYNPDLEFLWDADEEARLKQMYAEEEAATTVKGLGDYTDYGVTLPEPVVEAMKRTPHQADILAFRAHSEQIVAALEEYGFEFDRGEMLKLLTVGPLTSLEQSADVGNMPRFLRTLGIDGVFAEAPETAEAAVGENNPENGGGEQGAAEINWSKFRSRALLKKVAPLLEECEPTAIAGGPIELAHVSLLRVLAHLCAERPTTFVRLEFANESVPPDRSWEYMDELEVRRSGARWEFCFETPFYYLDGADRSELDSDNFAKAVLAVPDGTQVELAFVVEGLAEQCHRYAGTCRDRRLAIERAHPRVTAAVLSDALRLVERMFDSRPIELQSKREEQEVRRTYQRANGDVAKIRNRKIKTDDGSSRRVVVQSLLFERFAGRSPWDIAAARTLVEADWQAYENMLNASDDEDEEAAPAPDESSAEASEFADMLQRMSQAVEQFNAAKTVPHGDEIVFEGRTGKFLRASMLDLKQISQDHLDGFDAMLAPLGFECIGDFVGDADQRQEVTRCYSGHRQAIAVYGQRNADNQFGWAPVAHGMVMVDFAGGVKEFHTHFEDGTTLVTTSIDATTSKTDVGIYVRCYEDIPVPELWNKHVDGIRRFKTHRHTVPVDHTRFVEPALCLAALDDLLARFTGMK